MFELQNWSVWSFYFHAFWQAITKSFNFMVWEYVVLTKHVLLKINISVWRCVFWRSNLLHWSLTHIARPKTHHQNWFNILVKENANEIRGEHRIMIHLNMKPNLACGFARVYQIIFSSQSLNYCHHDIKNNFRHHFVVFKKFSDIFSSRE